MKERILVDTSALYALSNRSDKNHPTAVRIAHRLSQENAYAYTTNYIVAETHALLLVRMGPGPARKWLQTVNIPVEQALETDQNAGREII